MFKYVLIGIGLLFIAANIFEKYFIPKTKSLGDDKLLKFIRLENSMYNMGIDLVRNEKEHFENWLNYLFNLTNIKPTSSFGDIMFNYKHVRLVYSYDNVVYKIQITSDINTLNRTNIDNSLKRGIIDAVIIKDDESMNVSKDLKRFIGPNNDFHKCLLPKEKDIFVDLEYILYQVDLNNWDKIFITDTFGETIELNLNESKMLKWNPNFTI